MVGQSFDEFFEQSGFNSLYIRPPLWCSPYGSLAYAIPASGGCNPLVYASLLFLLLIALLVYSFSILGLRSGLCLHARYGEAITADSWLIAMGQAFFTLSLGMGTMMAYGAYVPDDANLGTTVVTIAALDTRFHVPRGWRSFPSSLRTG